MTASDAKRMGRRAEELVAAEYQRRGWSVLLRNWRPRGLGLRGELDLVVRRGELLAVVEVKARRREGPVGGAREAVDIRKRRRLARLADALLVSRPDLRGLYVRFDVAAVTWEPELDRPSLELIEDAFRL
jgi:putative endonuclease